MFVPIVFFDRVDLDDGKRMAAMTANYYCGSLVNNAGVALTRLWFPPKETNFLESDFVGNIFSLGLNC